MSDERRAPFDSYYGARRFVVWVKDRYVIKVAPEPNCVWDGECWTYEQEDG